MVSRPHTFIHHPDHSLTPISGLNSVLEHVQKGGQIHAPSGQIIPVLGAT